MYRGSARGRVLSVFHIVIHVTELRRRSDLVNQKTKEEGGWGMLMSLDCELMALCIKDWYYRRGRDV